MSSPHSLNNLSWLQRVYLRHSQSFHSRDCMLWQGSMGCKPLDPPASPLAPAPQAWPVPARVRVRDLHPRILYPWRPAASATILFLFIQFIEGAEGGRDWLSKMESAYTFVSQDSGNLEIRDCSKSPKFERFFTASEFSPSFNAP